MTTNQKPWGFERTEKVEAAARSGDAGAQAELGVRYHFGHDGLTKDTVRAVEWYRKAAEQGLAEAQACLAGMYENGEGVEKDELEAVKWLRKAADGGSISSQRLLADRYFEGKGVPEDRGEANKWYRKVFDWAQKEAETGERTAQMQLGDFYLLGQGVQQDIPTAIKWYKKSAFRENGEMSDCYATANEALEKIYLAGKWPATSHSEAVNWFLRAADEGYPKAQYIVGLMYRHGQGFTRNNFEALKWFQKAADHKHFADWPRNPADGEPKIPEARIAVEEMKKLLAVADDSAKQVVFGGLDDLCAAIERNNIERARVLVAGGACVTPPKNERRDRTPFLIAASKQFTQGEVGGICDGYDAGRHDYWRRAEDNHSMLRLLADNGALAAPTQDSVVRSSILEAARVDNAAAISIILEARPEMSVLGARPDLSNYSEDVYQSALPLEIAAESGSFQAVKILLKLNANDWRVSSPFELALKGGYTRTAKELVKYIPDKFPMLKQYSFALFEMLLWCAVDNHTESFRKLAAEHLKPLKNNRSDFDLWWKKETTLKQCFDYACRFASLEMVKLVFDETETLDVNRDGIGGISKIPTLIYASEKGDFDLVEFCLRIGADPFLLKDGMTALDISRRKGHTKLAVLLEQAMKGNYVGKTKLLFRRFHS